MSHILVCSVPNPGHVSPMLRIAEHLKEIGHHVTFNTSEHFRSRVEPTGVSFVPFTGKANYDYRTFNRAQEQSSVAERKTYQATTFFAETIPDQYEGIQRIMAHEPIDLIVVDTAFFGIYPMLLGPKNERPPVIGCGVNPMFLFGKDSLPLTDTEEGRRAVEEERRKIRSMFQPVQDRMDAVMERYGTPPMPHFFIDCLYYLSDVFLQFTVEAFEFPRSDMPNTDDS